MRTWAQQLEAQRRIYREKEMSLESYRMNGTSHTEFEFMRGHNLTNPYMYQVDEDDDDDDANTLVGSGNPSWAAGPYPPKSDFDQSRNGSQSSLRTRSTTSESGGPPPSAAAQSRAQPPRMPLGSMPMPGQPALSLRTQQLQHGVSSPGDRGGAHSYFSPTGESPMLSSRTSASSGTYPFPRQNIQQNGYQHDEAHQTNARFTAPAMGRPAVNREPSGQGAADPYGRIPLRGGPTQRGMHSAQQMPAPRNRSVSSPDIHQGPRGALRAGTQPPIPDMPASYQGYNPPPHMVPRSQTSSPSLPNGGMPPRAQTQSPSSLSQRERVYPQMRQDEPGLTLAHPAFNPVSSAASQYIASPRGATPVAAQRHSPPQLRTSSSLPAAPAQLKVKVHCPSASQVLTLVVPLSITYQTLKDRIDAKLQRSTNLTLGGGGAGAAGVSKDNVVKLKYLDEDDFVTIQTDEDVQEAFDSWRDQADSVEMGGMGEVELFCQR